MQRKVRLAFSKLSSLLLLFQRTPIVQWLLPEAKVLGTSGAGEIVKWTVATVAGLGAFDTVAGASTVTQLAPSPNSTTVAGTQGAALSFTFQYGGSDTPDHFQVIGTLPSGLSQSKSRSSKIDTISGVPTVAGSYNITIKAWRDFNQTSNSVSANFTITVAPGSVVVAPEITKQPSSKTIEKGTAITLSAAASGTAPKFQWYIGASGTTTSPIAGATSATFTTPSLTTTTRYWVRAKNSAGSASSSTAKVTVQSVMAITKQPASVAIPKGSSTTLAITVTGSSPTYQWYLGKTGDTSNPVANATSAKFTTPALKSTKQYWVKVKNKVSSVNSKTVTVTVATAAAPQLPGLR